ncbi:hypothetical protein [Streptomyces kanasensis]
MLGIIGIVLVKGGCVRVGSALACTLFGCTLGATGLAPRPSTVVSPRSPD